MAVGADNDLQHEVYCQQALSLELDGRYEDAIKSYEHALALAPGHLGASFALARVYQWRLGSPQRATAIYLELLRKGVAPSALPAAYLRLAQTFLEFDLDDIRRKLLDAVSGDHHVVALRALVIALVRGGRYDDARALGAQLLASNPDDAELLAVLAEAVTEQLHDVALAESYYQRALRIDPLNRGVLKRWLLHLLRVGEVERGYDLACTAMKAPPYANDRFGGAPPWDGSDPRGKRIIVDGMMGFGDSVQGARVATILHDAGARVTVVCWSSVHRLIRTVRGADRVIDGAGEPEPSDGFLHPFTGCALLNRSIDSLGALVPYITAAPDSVDRWKALLPDTPNLKVALTWSSNAFDCENRHRFRSMTFADLAPVLEVPGVDFYSLQCGSVPRRELRMANVSQPVRDLADGLTDFMETAAAIMAMDLVITVDTAVAHVAGALGRPTFVLLPYTPSFRWPLDRRDYPWYPTMRTWRQSTPGVWSVPVREVRDELAERARRPAARAPQRPSP